MPKCPYCDSYDTRTAVENYAGRAIVHAGRGILVLGAFTLGAACGKPSAGHAGAHTVWKGTEPGELKKNYCNKCKRYF